MSNQNNITELTFTKESDNWWHSRFTMDTDEVIVQIDSKTEREKYTLVVVYSGTEEYGTTYYNKSFALYGNSSRVFNIKGIEGLNIDIQTNIKPDFGGVMGSVTEVDPPTPPTPPDPPTPPTPPTPTVDYMYFEAAEANSTVALTSTLTTAPNLEYSTDGATWQEWQHTTADGTHTFDTLTLTAVGDRVYLRGENSDISDIVNNQITMFVGSGKMNSGGNITSLFNKTGEDSEIGGAAGLFANMGTSDFLLSAPTLNMTGFTGIASLMMLFYGQTSLATPAYMPNITFEDVFPETTGVNLDGTQMYCMYALTQVRVVSEDYTSIPSMPSFSLGNTVYFYISANIACPTVMDAENVALFLSANINTVRVQGRESVSGGYFFINDGLNAGTLSSVSIRDGRTVTFVAVPQSGYHIVKWIKADPLWSSPANTDIPDSATLTLSYNLPVKEGDTLYQAAIQPVFEQD